MEHLLLKVLIWSLYLPLYTTAECEDCACALDVGSRYNPDAVALSLNGKVLWWGECGSVKESKLAHVAWTMPSTHVTVAKWGRSDLSGYAGSLRRALSDSPLRQKFRSKRPASFEVISLPADCTERFLREDGSIDIGWDDVLDRIDVI